MVDKWYSLKCRIALAKELDIAPDNLDVSPVLEMVEDAQFYGEMGSQTANMMPDNEEQEKAIINQYYPVIIEKILKNKPPFEGFLANVMHERGII